MRLKPALAACLLIAFAVAVIVPARPAHAWSNKEHLQLTRIAALRLVNAPDTPAEMKAWLREAMPGMTDMEAEKRFFLDARVGIYPIGSLVLLESGRLAVVSAQNPAQLLTPTVTVFFSTRSNTYVRPVQVDLSQPGTNTDRILSAEAPEKWKVDPQRFLLAGIDEPRS